jgi:peptidoglycan/LPS O-acetylase OafA/YrhL
VQNLGKVVVVAGFALMAIGALMVWTDNPPFSENGIDRSAGLACLVLAIGAGATAALDRRPRGMLIATSAGAIALILALVDYADISGTSGAEVGTGLLLTLAGAVIATVASGAMAFAMFKKPAPAAARDA